MGDDTKKLRSAGFTERRCICRDVLGIYGTVVVVGTYALPNSPSTDLPRDDIIKALKKCIDEHPALHIIIRDAATENPWLENQQSLDLDEHVRMMDPPEGTQSDDESIRSLFEQAHNRKLDPWDVRPQWCVYVQPMAPAAPSTVRFRLAFAYSHALTDGRSGFNFHISFLRAMRGLDGLRYDVESEFHPAGNAQLAPPFDRAADLPISWSFLLGPLLNEYLPGFLLRLLGIPPTKPADSWTGAPERPPLPAPSDLVHTSVRVACVPSTTLERVLAICRTRKTRLTGVLHQLVVKSLARALRARGQRPPSLNAATPIDMRHLMPRENVPPSPYIANYTSTCTDVFYLNAAATEKADYKQGLSESEWAAARGTTEKLRQAVSTLADTPLGLFRYLSNFTNWTLKNARNPSDTSYMISNLGSFDGTGSADAGEEASSRAWQVDELIFCQSADLSSSPLGLNFASTHGGPLHVTISWYPGALGLDDEAQFVEEICAALVRDMDMIAAE